MLNIERIANGLSNFIYKDSLQATKELVELFNTITKKPLHTEEDYIRMYDDNFYTYSTWEELVESEREQNNGLTAKECYEQLNKSIWKLPCGWYVQYV